MQNLNPCPKSAVIFINFYGRKIHYVIKYTKTIKVYVISNFTTIFIFLFCTIKRKIKQNIFEIYMYNFKLLEDKYVKQILLQYITFFKDFTCLNIYLKQKMLKH